MKLIIDIPDEVLEAIKFKKETGKLNPSELAVLKGTPLTSKQYKIIQRIHTVYAKGQTLDYIRNPLAWSLYQVWKEVDNEKR